MNCPKCQNEISSVLDTYHTKSAIRRRRKCLACEHRFSTYEIQAGEYRAFKQHKVQPTIVENLQKLLNELLTELRPE